MDRQIFRSIRKSFYVNEIEKAYIECSSIEKYKIIIWVSTYRRRELMLDYILRYNEKYKDNISYIRISRINSWDIDFKNGSSIKVTIPLQSQRGLKCNFSIIEDNIKDNSMKDNVTENDVYPFLMALHSTITENKTLLKIHSIKNKTLKTIVNKLYKMFCDTFHIKYKGYTTFNFDDLK